MISKDDVVQSYRDGFNTARQAMLSALDVLCRNKAATAVDVEETTCAMRQVMACHEATGE